MPPHRVPRSSQSPRPPPAAQSWQGCRNGGSETAAAPDGRREQPGLLWLRRRHPASQPAPGRGPACHAQHFTPPYRPLPKIWAPPPPPPPLPPPPPPPPH